MLLHKLSGGYPCKDLRHKFLMAQESDVVDFSDESFPKEIEVIPLPGHFFDMAGFRMPDGGWCSLRTASAAGRRWINMRFG